VRREGGVGEGKTMYYLAAKSASRTRPRLSRPKPDHLKAKAKIVQGRGHRILSSRTPSLNVTNRNDEMTIRVIQIQ